MRHRLFETSCRGRRNRDRTRQEAGRVVVCVVIVTARELLFFDNHGHTCSSAEVPERYGDMRVEYLIQFSIIGLLVLRRLVRSMDAFLQGRDNSCGSADHPGPGEDLGVSKPWLTMLSVDSKLYRYHRCVVESGEESQMQPS